MPTPILATKLYVPPPRPRVVPRPHLVKRLNEGLHGTPGVTLVSAPAGFGKTTLVSEWIANGKQPVAWLSLDEGDSEPTRFLAYLVAALQRVAAELGEGIMAALHASQPQPSSVEALLTALLNEVAALPSQFILVLDDYHQVDSQLVDQALTFLIDHQPPQMHLVIATREDPDLPVARLRARGRLIELRASDLRLTPAEAAQFLNQVMGLNLAADDIAALEARTEGWIAGLQLAAMAMQGRKDATSFIEAFTGSHYFVMDYLVEEVLHQQPEGIQAFLLRTSILNRLCGPLCDAVLGNPVASGQATLEYLERANLFITPLDDERRWYRYHRLFADLLRQRLHQSLSHLSSPSMAGTEGGLVAEAHIRASQWHEDNGLELEAFHHAVAANDIERAERLISARGMPLHYRATVTAILDWLESLPRPVKDARPSLWVKSATVSLVFGQTTGVEERLQAAEKALQDVDLDDRTRDLIGQIACARATLALTRYQPEAMLVQARRALEYVHPDNLPFRFTANWALSSAYFLLGDRAAAAQACMEGLAISEKSGDMFSTVLALSDLGQIQELQNQPRQAAATYQRLLSLLGDHPQPNAGEVHLGLARIYYQWNDLEAAEQHGQQSLQLVRLYDRVIDRFILSEVFLARLRLAQGDVAGAAAMLTEVEQTVRQQNFVHRMPEVAAAQVLVLLRQGELEAAAQLAQAHPLPLSQARVHLAQGEPSAALAVLEPLRQQMEEKGWQDERLRAMVLQAVAHHGHGDEKRAQQVLGEALALAEPGGFIRLFVDEGLPMAQLLTGLSASPEWGTPRLREYTRQLLAAFDQAEGLRHPPATQQGVHPQPLVEPLSQRELEVLGLIAQGLSNREIGQRLFLALDTVKGHNRRIYGKLEVQSRTEAVARARDLGLLD